MVKKKRYDVFIDPGNHTGIIVIKNCEIYAHYFIKEPFLSKANEFIFNSLKKYKEELRSTYIEGVELWKTEKSIAAALKGITFALAYRVGAHMALIERELNCKSTILKPSVWKKNLTDKQVAHRVQLELNFVYNNDHLNSAVGMWLFTQGRL